MLTYHRVLAQPDAMQPPEQIDAACFSSQMSTISRCFNVLPLSEAVDMLIEGRVPKRALAITFDDGYEDNHSVALPILERHRLPATFFVCTAYLDNGLMFNDVVTEAIRHASGDTLDLNWLGLGLRPIASLTDRQGLARELIQFIKYQQPEHRPEICDRLWQACAGSTPRPQLMMSPQQVRDLSKRGMTIGGHTHSHPILSKVSLSEARQDILRNRQGIADITGHTPTLFAYPNGRPGTDYGLPQRNLIEELGFKVAVTTAWGVATRQVDPLQVPRFAPWHVSGERLTLQLLKNTQTGKHPAMA